MDSPELECIIMQSIFCVNPLELLTCQRITCQEVLIKLLLRTEGHRINWEAPVVYLVP